MEILRVASSPWDGLEIPLAGSQPSRCLCRGFILGERSQRPSEAATGVNHGRFNPGVGALPRSAHARARRRAGLNADALSRAAAGPSACDTGRGAGSDRCRSGMLLEKDGSASPCLLQGIVFPSRGISASQGRAEIGAE